MSREASERRESLCVALAGASSALVTTRVPGSVTRHCFASFTLYVTSVCVDSTLEQVSRSSRTDSGVHCNRDNVRITSAKFEVPPCLIAQQNVVLHVEALAHAEMIEECSLLVRNAEIDNGRICRIELVDDVRLAEFQLLQRDEVQDGAQLVAGALNLVQCHFAVLLLT